MTAITAPAGDRPDHVDVPMKQELTPCRSLSASTKPKSKLPPSVGARFQATRKSLTNSWKKFYRATTHAGQTTWLPEFLTLSLSIASLATIAVIVSVYDGHAAPSLPRGITLNAVVSILSTVSKSALIFVVAGCISQLKLSWFHTPQRLNDAQILEDASPGPLGSLTLLTTRLSRSVASLGALITILALASDPFLQQLISYPVKKLYGDSTLATTKSASSFHVGHGEVVFISAINEGIWSAPVLEQPDCPSGNCSWTEYTSVGWCSKYEDVTQQSVLKNCEMKIPKSNTSTEQIPCRVELSDSRNISTPITYTNRLAVGGGESFTFFNYLVVPLSGVEDIQTEFSDDQDAPQYDAGVENPMFSMVYIDMDPLEPGVSDGAAPPLNSVQECVLDICFTEYVPTVQKGISDMSSSRTQRGKQFQKTSPVIVYGRNGTYQCWRQPDVPESDLNLSSIYPDRSNNQNNGGMYGPSGCDVLVDTNNRAFCLETDGPMSPCTGFWSWAEEIAFWLESNSSMENALFGGSPSLTYASLPQVIEDVMTVGTPNSSIMYGQAALPVTHVEARLEWMILPALLEVAAIMLLGLTMARRRRTSAPMWKDSVLSTFFHGFEDELRAEFAGVGATVLAVEEEAKMTKARLKVRKIEGGEGDEWMFGV